MSDTTILLLEEIRQYLNGLGCKDSKKAALHVVRLVYGDLMVNLQDKGSRAQNDIPTPKV